MLFGAATSTLTEMDAALARVIARHADSTDAKIWMGSWPWPKLKATLTSP